MLNEDYLSSASEASFKASSLEKIDCGSVLTAWREIPII